MDIRKKTFTAASTFICGRTYNKGDDIEDMALVARLLDTHPNLLTETKPPPTPTKEKEAD